MVIVTSGIRYMDIDAYACCMAYADLLDLQGIPAIATSSVNLNESITKSMKAFSKKLEQWKPNPEDEFFVMDVSNPKHFDPIVKQEKIVGIIDHHVGFEKYWEERLGKKAQIEFIGAAATLVFEQYEKLGLVDQITNEVAYLLMAAILDNTLNLKANVTTKRDRDVFKKLQKIVKDEGNFAKEYFIECQENIQEDFEQAIAHDTKIEKSGTILPDILGQLVVWEKDWALQRKEIIRKVLGKLGEDWIMNLICLKEGTSYILSSNLKTHENMQKLLQGEANENQINCGGLILRKEILKKAWEDAKRR